MLLFEKYAESVQEGELLTRLEIAERVGRKKTTAFIGHLERAVQEGVLHKCWCTIGNNAGWGYATPTTMPRLVGME